MPGQTTRAAAVELRKQLAAAGEPAPPRNWTCDDFAPRDRVRAGLGWGTVQAVQERSLTVLLDVWASRGNACPIAYAKIAERVAGTFVEASIGYHRDKHAKELGVQAGTYLVTAVWRDQYEPLRHGKERRGVRVDLGTVRRYRQDLWPVACLACDTPLPNATTRAAGGASLVHHHETDHPRRTS